MKGHYYLADYPRWEVEAPEVYCVGIFYPLPDTDLRQIARQYIGEEWTKKEIFFRAMWPVVGIFGLLPFEAKIAILGYALDFRKECEENGVDWRPFHQQEYPYAILGGQKSHFEGTIYERLP